MIRKLILPALAVAMLVGCATTQYRGGASGDYYYGQPSTEYRYYDAPYGTYGYSPDYGYGGSVWSGSIGYSTGGYGYPRYPRYPTHSGGHSGGGHSHDHEGHGPRPGQGHGHHQGPGSGQPTPPPTRPRPPWRDLGSLGSKPRQAGPPARHDGSRVAIPPVRRQKRDAHRVSAP